MNSNFQIHSYWAQNKWVTILWSYSRLCYDYDTDFNQNSTLVCILYWNGEGNQFWFASCFELICWDCNIVWWLGSRFRSNISNISIKKCTFHYKWFNGVRLSWGQIKISELPEKNWSWDLRLQHDMLQQIGQHFTRFTLGLEQNSFFKSGEGKIPWRLLYIESKHIWRPVQVLPQ